MGFFEILLIAVVTLLVVGPERMPEAVRSVALTIGRIKRAFNQAKAEVEKQVGADEIRLQLHNEEVMANLEKMQQETAAIVEPQHKPSSTDEALPPEKVLSPETTVVDPRIKPES